MATPGVIQFPKDYQYYSRRKDSSQTTIPTTIIVARAIAPSNHQFTSGTGAGAGGAGITVGAFGAGVGVVGSSIDQEGTVISGARVISWTVN